MTAGALGGLLRRSPRAIAILRIAARNGLLEHAPSDLQRSLRRIADGELGRIRAPDVEETGRRMTRDVERLTGAVASAAFLIAGSLLVVAGGWHRPLGDALLAVGILGSVFVAVGALRGR